MSQSLKCPCKSGKQYRDCCKSLHRGKPAATALELMRSRFAAYALRLADYIIETTHKDNPGRLNNLNNWRKEILKFADQTRFEGLEIIETVESGSQAMVKFRAILKQGNRDAGFTESSRFRKEEGRWYYLSGETGSQNLESLL